MPERDSRGRFLPCNRQTRKAKAEGTVVAPTSSPGADLTAAIAGVLERKDNSPKLVKQLENLNDALTSLPERIPTLSEQDAAKTEDQLAKLREVITAVSAEEALSKKESRKLRRKIRSLRKKLEK